MKTSLSCIIIDDEPFAQDLIRKYIDRISYLTLIATYDNAITAMHGVSASQPDIIFLDVNMPEMTGVEFIKSFVGVRPNIIFTTAHAQYAHEGFEHDAIDYLLKPISFDRFMKALYKVEKQLNFNPNTSPTEPIAPAYPPSPSKAPQLPDDFFLVKADKKLIKIMINEIIYVEGMKDYIKIHLADHFVITHMTMTKITNLLPPHFIRINRSFIVQTTYIKTVEGNMIEMANGTRLTIGIKYRDEIRNKLNDWTI
uniref:LytTR family DNA-binding domain-containing protein n=1 Tax=Roseihalotalea indica TaxID=2867963 RepID=A0AA49GMX9_9BACT|nr:LytTR family DNA-binding domain-containing protein [Tunicatimonas sp. TK19036]